MMLASYRLLYYANQRTLFAQFAQLVGRPPKLYHYDDGQEIALHNVFVLLDSKREPGEDVKGIVDTLIPVLGPSRPGAVVVCARSTARAWPARMSPARRLSGGRHYVLHQPIHKLLLASARAATLDPSVDIAESWRGHRDRTSLKLGMNTESVPDQWSGRAHLCAQHESFQTTTTINLSVSGDRFML